MKEGEGKVNGQKGRTKKKRERRTKRCAHSFYASPSSLISTARK